MSHAQIWFFVTSLLDGTWVFAKQLSENERFSIVVVKNTVAFLSGLTIIPTEDIQNILLDDNLLNHDYLSAIWNEYQNRA